MESFTDRVDDRVSASEARRRLAPASPGCRKAPDARDQAIMIAGLVVLGGA